MGVCVTLTRRLVNNTSYTHTQKHTNTHMTDAAHMLKRNTHNSSLHHENILKLIKHEEISRYSLLVTELASVSSSLTRCWLVVVVLLVVVLVVVAAAGVVVLVTGVSFSFVSLRFCLFVAALTIL